MIREIQLDVKSDDEPEEINEAVKAALALIPPAYNAAVHMLRTGADGRLILIASLRKAA